MITLPTVAELKDNILLDLIAEFEVSLNPWGLAFLTALATVLANLLWLVYIYIGLTQKNIWVDTCDAETLRRFGVIILNRDLQAALSGQYTVTVTGTIGATIPSTTVFKSDDTSRSPGMLFQIDGGSHVMVGTSDTILVNALTGGLASRLDIGDTMSATAPITNVDNVATATVEDTEPVDAETTEEYRLKVIERIQLIPGSWSAVDYRLLGTTITGVSQTYAYATDGQSNEVDVFLQGNTAVASPGPSASAGVVTAYETALELVRPLSVWQVNYASCPINNADVTITMGGFTPFTTAQKALISQALTNFINAVKPFIAACDNVADRNDLIATFNLSSAITAAVPGYGFSAVTFTVAGVSTVSWTADKGNIAFFNSIVYA